MIIPSAGSWFELRIEYQFHARCASSVVTLGMFLIILPTFRESSGDSSSQVLVLLSVVFLRMATMIFLVIRVDVVIRQSRGTV